MNAVTGVALAVGVVSALMIFAAGLRKRVDLDPETARKIVHVGSGVLAMSFPWLFTSPYPVAAACGVSAVGLLVIRHTTVFPRMFKEALGSVDRGSGGEFYFPLAVALLFPLSGGDLALYLIPVCVLTFSDTAAAVLGSRYGLTHYRSMSGRKSIEGSVAFFVVTLAITYRLLLQWSAHDNSELLLIAVSVAVATTLAEAVATGGTDNLAVPLIAFLFLFLSLGQYSLAPWIEGSVVAVLGFILVALQRRGPRRGGPGYLRRMWMYLSEMFPIPLRMVTAGIYFLGVASMVRLALDVETTLWTGYTLLGVWTFFCHILILRLMDELKDVDVDRELFPHRPVPSGRVGVGDIKSGLVLATVAFIVPNISVQAALWMALVLLAYCFLMFRFFFIPDLLRENLLLNLATHNPVVAVGLLYVMVVVGAEHGLTRADADWQQVLLLIAFFWPPTFAWEIARKIRSQEEEDAYVTYSRIFGRRGALLVVAGAQSVSLLVGVHFYLSLHLSGLFLLVLVAAFAGAQWGHLRFALRPSPTTSQLRPYAEGFLFGVLAASLLEYLLGSHFNQM